MVQLPFLVPAPWRRQLTCVTVKPCNSLTRYSVRSSDLGACISSLDWPELRLGNFLILIVELYVPYPALPTHSPQMAECVVHTLCG